MRRANQRSLRFGPRKRVVAERRPMIFRSSARIHLVAQVAAGRDARFVRAKSGNLDVITQQIGILRNGIDFAGEKLLLIIEARTPREVRADFQIFAHALANHVRRVHAFGRIRVMRATGRMNVMIAGPPTALGRIDPAFHFEVELIALCASIVSVCRLRDRFRPARKLDRVFAVGQTKRFAVGAIDLRMKAEIRREPFRLARINAALRVANLETASGRLSVFVEDVESDRARRLRIKQNIDFIAEAEILRALPDIEHQFGFAFAGVAAVKLNDAIFEAEATQVF